MMLKQLREAMADRPQLGLCAMYPAEGIIERIGADWDWLWVDGQHGELGYNDVLAAVRAGERIGRPAVVRVPGHDPGAIGRSYGGRRPIDLFGRGYANPDQPQPLLICQIETPEGLANAEAIAAVEGVDVVFFGPDDMALREGLPMDAARPQGHFDEAHRRVAAAARAHGKHAGGVFVTPQAMCFAAEAGYRLVVCTADVMLLAEASKMKSEALRGALAAG